MWAVIPAAGLGTRFLPYTKAQPKEMLPVVDKPAIQYVVEEALASGLHDILVVTGKSKRAIEDHFDANVELARRLGRSPHGAGLRALESLRRRVRMTYVRQPEPRGLGDAVLCAEANVGGAPFALLLGDDVLVGDPPCTQQLIRLATRTDASVMAVQRVSRDRVPAYGMVEAEPLEGFLRVTGLKEKPSRRDVTSNLISIGRYVLTPGIFTALRKVRARRRKGELQLTDALHELAAQEDVYALVYQGKRYDVGDKLGWLEATIELALGRTEYRRDLTKFLQGLRHRPP